MRSGAVLAVGVAVLVATLVSVSQCSGSEVATPSESGTSVPPRVTPPAEPLEPAVVPRPVAAASDPERRRAQLELPDGTFVPALNGAVDVPSLGERWGARPWSPIERVERSNLGIDWYVHRDGTRTTTEMKWREDLGRYDALLRIGVFKAQAPPVKAVR